MTAAHEPVPSSGGDKQLILVVEDEKDIAELVRFNLEREGFAVITAADGEQGLDAARQQRPALLILDLMLPGMAGLEVCRRLRGDAATVRLPMVMLTAKAAEVDRILGLEMGADDYVTKPFSPRALLAKVREYLPAGGSGQR